MDKKTTHLKTITASIIIAAGLWIGLADNNICYASTIWDENFEGYSNGYRGGVAPWDTGTMAGATHASVAPHGGSRIVYFEQYDYSKAYGYFSDNYVTTGAFTWYTELENNGLSNGSVSHYIEFYKNTTGATRNNLCGQIKIVRVASGWEMYACSAHNTCSTLITTITSNEWHWSVFQWDLSAVNAADRWVRYKFGSTWSDKIYNPFSATCSGDGIGSMGIHGDGTAYPYLSYLALDDIEGFTNESIPGEEVPAIVSITYPVDESTTQAEFWTVDADMNDATTTDSITAWICYGTDPQCSGYSTITDCLADADCTTDHKTLAACDEATSTWDGTSNITLFSSLTNTSTYYAKAFLFGSDKDGGFCSSNGDSALIATSDPIWFIYSSDYLSNLDDADTFWAGGWGDMWGAATSTPGYSYGKNMIDSVAKPVLNIGAVWSTIFHPEQATNWGITAGENFKTMLQKIGGFFNIIPDFQLFLVLFVAVIFDLAIFFFRLFYRARKLLPK